MTRRARILVPVLLTAAGMLCSRAGLAHELDTFIADTLRQWGVPGMAVAVVERGKLVWAQGYGVREAGRHEPVDADTIFGIGSMTKSFTAAATGILVEEGRFTWDTSVQTVLPAFQPQDAWVARHATLRDLAAHRLGIDADTLWMMRSDSAGVILERSNQLASLSRFGDFQYSNVGILALGMAVERAAGASWESFVGERLLLAAGMTRSNVREDTYVRSADLATCWLCEPPPGSRRGRAALLPGESNAAAPHGLRLDKPLQPGQGREAEVWPWRHEGAIAPAGAINSTVRDMGRWLLLQLNEGELEGRRILSARQVREAHAFQVVRPASRPLALSERSAYEARYSLTGYGLGWAKYIYRGFNVSAHGGGQVGFGGTMWIVPERGLGVIVLQNLDYRHAPAYSGVMLRVIDHYLGLEPLEANAHLVRNWSPAYEGRELQAQLAAAQAPAAAALERFPGTYHHPALGEVEVVREGPRLLLRFEPACVAELRALQDTDFIAEFRANDHWLSAVTFVLDAHGEARQMLLGERGAQATYRMQRIGPAPGKE